MRKGINLTAAFTAIALISGFATASSAQQEDRLLAIVESFLQADDWHYSRVEDTTILSMGFRGNNGTWTCYARTREQEERFIFYSVLSTNVPEHMRLAAAEYLTRANYGMLIGNFELDFSDGEVRYKTSIDVEGGTLTHKMIENMIYVNVLTMDRYLPGLNRVVYGNVSPQLAIAEVEGQ